MLIFNRSALLLLLFSPAHLSAAAQDVVWKWSKQCKVEQRLRVTIRLESKMVFRGLLSICQGSRDAEDGRAEFHLSSSHLFDGRYRARKTDLIEGDIWQAGGETDALILGVSFATKHQVLLNTMHVAPVNRNNTTKLDTGLYITTNRVVAR